MQTLTLTTSHITHYRGTYHDREPVILYKASFGKIFLKFRSIQETIDNVKVIGKNREVQSRQCQTRDVDRDGDFEFIVAGYGTNRGAGAPNLVLSYNNLTRKLENLAIDDPNSPYYHIRNDRGKAIGVAGKIIFLKRIFGSLA